MFTGRRCGGTPVMSWPSIRMRPASGASKPASRRSRVVLPQPELPSSANSSPRAISRSTPSTAMISPKRLVAPSIWTIGLVITVGSAAGLDRGPEPRAFARLLGRPGADRVEPRAGAVRRIDPGVLRDRLVQERRRRKVGVGITGHGARGGGDLGLEHEVEEAVGHVGMRRVLRHGGDVD